MDLEAIDPGGNAFTGHRWVTAEKSWEALTATSSALICLNRLAFQKQDSHKKEAH